MSVRALLMGFVALASLVAAPVAKAGDFDKYVPANSEFYMHISVPKFFTSELVRKSVPMAFDKYGDHIVMFAGMAKQFNPQGADVPEDQIKQAVQEMSDPQKIAQVFDVAKTFVTDIMIAGSSQGDRPNVAIVIKCQMVTAEGAEMIAQMSKAFPQAGNIDASKKSGGTIYCMTPPQGDQKFFITVPEKGVLHIAMSEEIAEGSFAGKGNPGPVLAGRIAKRGAGDFIFATGTGNADADYTAMTVSLTLDKDLSGKMDAEFKDAATAADKAKDANEKLGDLVDRIKSTIGEKGDLLKTHIAKTKASADGKKVSASLSIPGTVVEELLKKE